MGSNQHHESEQDDKVEEWGPKIRFRGGYKYFVQNGEWLLRESISIFNGKTNPIRCLSIKELKSIKVGINKVFHYDYYGKYHKGVWEGRFVLVKSFQNHSPSRASFRDIVVSTQMGTHNNVHKFLACCLETEYPVLVFEWLDGGTLIDRISEQKNQTRSPLEWMDRLRIAWEISHAMSYLHTAFRRPIVHRNLKPSSVFLDMDDIVKLSDFSLSISIPEGEEFIEDGIMGTLGYIAPEYVKTARASVKVDVYAFGVLFLVLLTGEQNLPMELPEFKKSFSDNLIADILDPVITTSSMRTDEHFLHQMARSLKLALECTVELDSRPTMVDVATEIKSIIVAGVGFRQID